MKKIFIIIMIFNFNIYADDYDIRQATTMESDKGNGSDLIDCSNSNVFSGLYVLDYLTAIRILPKENYFTSANQIQSVLDNKIPSLGIEFRKIVTAYYKKLRKGRYIWNPLPPKERADEDLAIKQPEGCVPEPIQLVIRRAPNKHRSIFMHDPDKVKKIETHISWMFLHELLWNNYDSAFQIRLVNEFIHNKKNSTLSSKDFIYEMGLNTAEHSYVDLENYRRLQEAEKYLLKYKDSEADGNRSVDISHLDDKTYNKVLKIAEGALYGSLKKLYQHHSGEDEYFSKRLRVIIELSSSISIFNDER